MLPRYGSLGASSRLRLVQYVPFLANAGVEVDSVPLLGDQYLREKYAGNLPVRHIISAYFSRLRRLLKSPAYDVLWVEKELWPWLPAFTELAFLPSSARLIVDYDDAIFHSYDHHRQMAVRSLLGKKIDVVMRRADLVLAGSDYLADHARYAGSKWVEWLPTVVDLERYPLTTTKPSNRHVVIGWIGSPSTAKYLQIVAPALAELAARYDIRSVAIGARLDQVQGTPFEALPWTEQSEYSSLRSLDIGIMPLPDEPWERGKCAYKLVQYMACSLPVVASPVGANSQLVEHGSNGYLASTTADWVRSLECLIQSADLRTQLGSAGRQKVEGTYSIQAQLPRLTRMLSQLTGPRV